MIFVDAGAWYALSDSGDPNHRPAAAFYRDLARGRHGRLVTSDCVMDETYTLLRMRGGLGSVRRLRDLVEEPKSMELLWVSPEDFARALEMMLQHEDKRWSFTDCTSFVLMQGLGIQEAFAFDPNFAQAGFALHP